MAKFVNRLNTLIGGGTTPMSVTKQPTTTAKAVSMATLPKQKASSMVTKQVSDYGKAMAKASKSTKQY